MDKQEVYDKQNGKCFYCKKEMLIDGFQYNHLYPLSVGTDFDKNIVLCCPECNLKNDSLPFREAEFNSFISELLRNNKQFKKVRQEAIIPRKGIRGRKYIADIIAERQVKLKWEIILIELKAFPTFTSKRIDDIIKQIEAYAEKIDKNIKMIIGFPGILPVKDYERFRKRNIEVWDREYIIKTFQNEIEESKNLILKNFFTRENSQIKKEEFLIEKLKGIKAGKEEWSKYQKHIEKVLDYLLGEELSSPITELSDKFGINRRDFILRNYSENGFWKYLREQYQADFIVIDAKNYVGKITKKEVLQLSNYLKSHGPGLFAIIISRNGEEDNGAYYTRREKWITERKMIIILNDSDLEKMILSKSSLYVSAEIIKQRIEDFRLEM